MGLKVGTVKLEEYNSNWAIEFEKEKKVLKEMFKDVALTIEHIGSTSVEGLSSKPIVDIAVGINSLDDFKKVSEKFEKFPYSIKEDSVSDEILIRKGSTDNRTHFIHVMEVSSKRYQDTIVFRDYLRNNKKVMLEYENLKRILAVKYSNDRKMYTSSKNKFINDVIEKAYNEIKNN